MTGPAVRFGLHAAWARRRRLAPYVLLLAVGLGIVAAATGIAARATGAAQDTVDRDKAGRVVDVEVDDVTGSATRLTTATLGRLRGLPDVEAVLPATEVPIGVKTEDIPGVLFVGTTLQTSRPPMVAPRGPVPAPRAGRILLPARAQGSDLGGLVGRAVGFEVQRAVGVGEGRGEERRLTVSGVYDPSYQVDGRDVAYLDERDVVALAALGAGMSPQRWRTTVGFDSAQLVARDEHAAGVVMQRVQALGLAATSLSQRYEELPTVLSIARVLGVVLGVLLIVLVGAAAAVQTAMAVRARWTEIGVLRATGFSRRDALVAFATEASAATLAGTVLGIALALPVSLALVGLLGADTRAQAHLSASALPAVGPVALFAGLTLVAGVLGALVAARRAARLDPSRLLRGA